MEIRLKVTAVDFMYLRQNGSYWSDAVTRFSDEELRDRYKNESTPGALPGRQWKREYTFGTERVNLMLGLAFLEAKGVAYELIYDMYTWDNGMEIGWLVLTDYDYETDPEFKAHEAANAEARAQH
ncbi:hypothetical protein ACFVXC_06145 [Streptomyces sp. NPDC058257]|uniref:hypothetical protein n=1 Tax=Streptomyces sp. NPDC058257 TaxID=3346409 RepID=UPI0036F06508